MYVPSACLAGAQCFDTPEICFGLIDVAAPDGEAAQLAEIPVFRLVGSAPQSSFGNLDRPPEIATSELSPGDAAEKIVEIRLDFVGIEYMKCLTRIL